MATSQSAVTVADVPDVIIAATMKILVGSVDLKAPTLEEQMSLRAAVRWGATSRRFRAILYCPRDPEQIWAEFRPYFVAPHGLVRHVARQCRKLDAIQDAQMCQKLTGFMPMLTSLTIQFHADTPTDDVQTAMRCLAPLPLDCLTVIDNHGWFSASTERSVTFTLPPTITKCHLSRALWAVSAASGATFPNTKSMHIEIAGTETIPQMTRMNSVQDLYFHSVTATRIDYSAAKRLWSSFPGIERLHLSTWVPHQVQVMQALHEECHSTLKHFASNMVTKTGLYKTLLSFEHLQTIECFCAYSLENLAEVTCLNLFVSLTLTLHQGDMFENLTATLDKATSLCDLVLIINGDCFGQLAAIFKSKCCDQLRRLHMCYAFAAEPHSVASDPNVVAAFKTRLGKRLTKLDITYDRMHSTVSWLAIVDLLECCQVLTDLGLVLRSVGSLVDTIIALECPLINTVRNLDIEGHLPAKNPGTWPAVRSLTLNGNVSTAEDAGLLAPELLEHFPALRRLADSDSTRPSWLPSHIKFN